MHTHTSKATRIALSGLLACVALVMIATAAPPVSHDFNADGTNDYPVSITGHDPADPVTGAARTWSGASKAVIDTIVSPDTNTLFGWSVGSAGDLNADGHDDLIVGEPLWMSGGSPAGRVRVFSGADGSVLLSVTGPYLETGLGRYVAGIGDWNGDGTPDIAVSGWDVADLNNDGVGDDAIGMVFILSGADGSVLAEIIEPTGTELFGYSVFGLGDITGDGLADIAVVDRGAPGANGAAGVVYIFTGRAQTGQLTAADAHRTILNDDPTLRGFAAHIDTMHPDLWLDQPTLQIISLTAGGTGGPNQAETAIEIRKADGQLVADKGVRPSLVLAGDVNLDGRVDALDLQESIAQLGTDPQALGVMPLADLNDDGVIDTLDIALLLDGYGDETDIYQGLWDGSRLLATVGASAGFGSIGGTGVVGGQIGPGRRPVDDCLRNMPGDQGTSLLPWLLRSDARANCQECPGCDDPDPQGCYECHESGEIVGGELSVTPDQPKPGDTAVFSWTPFEVVGRKNKCKASCGGDQDSICALDPIPHGVGGWVLEKKDANGQWVQVSSGNYTDTVQVTGAACEEYRLRLTSAEFPANGNCGKIDAVEKEKEIQFAEFTLDWECVVETSAGIRRATLGIGEAAKVWVVEPGAGNAVWQTSGNAQTMTTPNGDRYFRIITPGPASITATINGCNRTLNFTGILPKKINYTKCDRVMWHTQGLIDLRFAMWIKLEPDTVSFYQVEFREVSGPATNITGDFALSPSSTWYHHAGGAMSPDPDNVVRGGDVDLVGLGPLPAGNGGFDWVIPLEVRVLGVPSNPWIRLPYTVKQEFRLNDTCLTISKDGDSHTACRDHDSLSPDLDNPQCPP